MKRILLFILVLVFILSITGCSKISNTNEKTDKLDQNYNYAIISTNNGDIIKEGKIIGYQFWSDSCVFVYFEDCKIRSHTINVIFFYDPKYD